MNAIDGALRAELRAARRSQARDRDDVRAVVLYGGERGLRGGRRHQGDVRRCPTPTVTSWGTQPQEALTVVARLPKPVVAAVTGYALGGGVRAGADGRLPRSSARQGEGQPVPESRSASSRARAARSASPGWSVRPRPRTSSSPAATWPRRRRSRSASPTGWCPTPSVYETARELDGLFAARARRSPCARPSRRSTTVSSSTSTPALRLESAAVRGAVRHRGPEDRGWRRSSSRGRARRASRTVTNGTSPGRR